MPKINYLEKAKTLIENFCIDEYDSHADFSDLSNIDILYTTITDDELPLQISIDLENYRFLYFVDGKLRFEEEYNTIDEMVKSSLEHMDFNSLVGSIESVIENERKRIDIFGDSAKD